MKPAEITIAGYYFPDVPDLVWHSGKFWIGNKEQPIVYNNGSRSVLLYGSSKKSLIRLRKNAHPCTLKLPAHA